METALKNFFDDNYSNSVELPLASDRIESIREELLRTKNSICLERPLLMRAFRKSSQGKKAKKEHPLVRRSLELSYILSNRMPKIYDRELIIGNMTSKRIAANYYPEGGSINILEDIFRLEKRKSPIVLTGPEKRQLIGIGLTTLFSSIGGKALLRPGRLSHFLDFFRAKRYFITEEAGIGHQVGGYKKVVHNGLKEADGLAARCLENGSLDDGTPLTDDHIAFYRSVIITINGIRQMAENLADKAEHMAHQPGIAPGRKSELLLSAKACRHVPYEPSRSFQEGLQACWLVHVAMNLEDFEQGMSFGRLDQILYPLFKNDMATGVLSYDEALEIMAGFQLKTCETIPIYSERIDQYFSGGGVAQGITMGGTDESGKDATNRLSGLILDAYACIKTREPALHVRVHSETPAWFIDKSSAVIQLGCGKPSFFGDEQVVRALEGAGMTKAHARDYAVIGCVEMASQGRTYNSSDAALFNLPLCLELALNRGYRFMGREFPGFRMGAPTHPVTRMQTFDDVIFALNSQVKDAMDEMVKVIAWLEATYRIWRPTPINSIVTKGCLETGKDVTWGGGFYDLTSIQAAGLADTGDSLYALKRLVFDEQRFSLKEFVDILKHNFNGYEALQREITTKFPRYGNGHKDADAMTQLAADIFSDSVRSYQNSRGGKYVPGIYSMTCHIGFGRHTGALPNGRPAGNRLSNGLSPIDGSDKNGPTALLSSAASLDSSKWANCCALNIKFDKKTVQGQKGVNILSSLFKTYFEQGGMQVQVNVLDAETLLEAKRDPSLWPGLVVRVAGYCAYFNDLRPDVQDEIIERTVCGIGIE